MHLPPHVLNAIIGIGIIIGAIQCFFGYRIFKVILGLASSIQQGARPTPFSCAGFRSALLA